MTMYRDRNVWAGLAAGVAGGLAASWVMGHYQNLWYKFTSKNRGQRSGQQKQENQDQNPTVKTASAISRALARREIPEHRKAAAGAAVHYTFGALVGGAYGVAAELAPATRKIAGLPFGTAVWLAADEIALPLLKLTPGPTEVPRSSHALGVTSHLVYGAVADGVRRIVRRLLT